MCLAIELRKLPSHEAVKTKRVHETPYGEGKHFAKQSTSWLKAQKAQAKRIIKSLPAELKEWAKEDHVPDPFTGAGPRSYKVLLLEPGHIKSSSGLVVKPEDLLGVGAMVSDWAYKEGFKVLVVSQYEGWDYFHFLVLRW